MRIFFASAASLVTDSRAWGEGLIAWHLIDGLARRGHEVVACADQIDVASHSSAVFERLDVGRFESLQALTRPRAIAAAAAKHARNGRFDVVHWLFPQHPEDMRLPRLPGSRALIGPLPQPWPDVQRRPFRAGDLVRAPLRPLLRRRYGRELARADVLLSSLPEVEAGLPSGLRNKCVLLPFGISVDRFTVAEMPSQPSILFLGRLIPEKRPALLLRAFASVSHDLPSVRLVFAGEGAQRPALEAEAHRLGASERVTFLGEVPHDAVPSLLASSSVLCLPSTGEPYGMAVLEAMAAGRPVIAVAMAGPRFLIDQGTGGRLVPPDDESALAHAIREVLEDPAMGREMGSHNRAKVEREFGWARILDRLEHAYAGALPKDLQPASLHE